MTDLICPKCGKTYSSTDLRLLRCTECKTWLQWTEVKRSDPSTEHLSSAGIAKAESAVLDQATRALVEASDRTTAAVRSIAVYFFTMLTSSLIAGVLVAFGYSSQSPALVIMGSLAALVGFLIALVSGLSELRRSRR